MIVSKLSNCCAQHASEHQNTEHFPSKHTSVVLSLPLNSWVVKRYSSRCIASSFLQIFWCYKAKQMLHYIHFAERYPFIHVTNMIFSHHNVSSLKPSMMKNSVASHHDAIPQSKPTKVQASTIVAMHKCAIWRQMHCDYPQYWCHMPVYDTHTMTHIELVQ